MMYTTLISIEEAANVIKTGKCCILDCSFDLTNPEKGKALYASAHIPGARYLHLDDDLAGKSTGSNGRHPLPDPETLVSKLREEGVDTSAQIIAYDNAGGPFAARLWWLMRWLGHQNIAVLNGSITDWQAAGNLVEQGGFAPIKQGNFELSSISQDMVVDVQQVTENLSSSKALVVDARSAARFRGDELVIDKVAGHIPGARNRPFTDNLTSEGRFKEGDVLRQEFENIIEGFEPADVILQCGSGVTACHNMLAMHHAGLVGTRLYPGSWSEWENDPARPVALGDHS